MNLNIILLLFICVNSFFIYKQKKEFDELKKDVTTKLKRLEKFFR